MTATPQTAEQDLVTAIESSQKTLGMALPRLITQKPQIAMNAIRHQLTGQSLFMPPAELAIYLCLGYELIFELRPVGIFEIQHLQRMIDTNWRLNRALALEGIVFNSSVATLSMSIKEAEPSIDDEALIVTAQSDSYRNECSELFEKLGRHVARMERSMRQMRADFNEMRNTRVSKRGDQYNCETCPASMWYRKLADLSAFLIAARRELKEKSVTVVTPVAALDKTAISAESTTSTVALFSQNTVRLVTPLTPRSLDLFDQARANGLLTPDEREVLTHSAAA